MSTVIISLIMNSSGVHKGKGIFNKDGKNEKI